jgi:hypothetical protein
MIRSAQRPTHPATAAAGDVVGVGLHIVFVFSDASLEAEDSDELQELEEEEEEEEEAAAAAERAAGQLGARTEVYDEGAGSYEVGCGAEDYAWCQMCLQQSCW